MAALFHILATKWAFEKTAVKFKYIKLATVQIKKSIFSRAFLAKKMIFLGILSTYYTPHDLS